MINASIGVIKPGIVHGYRTIYESNHQHTDLANRVYRIALNFLMIGLAAAFLSAHAEYVPPIVYAVLGWAAAKNFISLASNLLY